MLTAITLVVSTGCVTETPASKRGGTEGIARILGEALQREGMDVELVPAESVGRVMEFDAALVGGAL